jgi:Anti-sigma-K factor rskA/Putative zinc-finger
MERDLTHEEIQELLGAYALDAVDRDEADAIERHLPDCPRCSEELVGHREAAALLAHVGAPAPEGVWDKIAARLGERAEGEPGRAASIGEAEAAAAAAEIAGLAEARSPRRPGAVVPLSRPTRWLAGALAAAAVIVAVLGVQLVRIDNRLDRLAGPRGDDLDAIALAAFADPSARQVRLKSDDGDKVADVALLPDGQAYLIARSLPALSAAETYQLWAVVGDQKISVGVLGNKPSVTAFHYHAEPSVLAITAEKAGGVVASEKQAVVVGFVEPKSA